MDFGEAIRELKAGRRVARAGWNGKGMWLALTPGSVIRAKRSADDGLVPIVSRASLRGATLAYQNTEDPDQIFIGAHIDMRAADGTLVIGWLASQTDMLAEDWVQVGG